MPYSPARPAPDPTGSTHPASTASPGVPALRRGVRVLAAGLAAAGLVVAGGLVGATSATAAPSTAVPKSATSHPTLRPGNTGPAVQYVERRLGMANPDTRYDNTTRWVVAYWQRSQGLPGTGVITSASWAKMGVKLAKPKPGTASHGKKILAEAARHRGKPYRWGATGPSSFDCSGYVGYVYKKATGKKLPRTSAQMRSATKRISRSQLRPGDLVFVHSGGRVGHVAIYGGSNTWWEATRPGRPVGKHKGWSSSVSYGRVV